jgi:hypothetical protein
MRGVLLDWGGVCVYRGSIEDLKGIPPRTKLLHNQLRLAIGGILTRQDCADKSYATVWTPTRDILSGEMAIR